MPDHEDYILVHEVIAKGCYGCMFLLRSGGCEANGVTKCCDTEDYLIAIPDTDEGRAEYVALKARVRLGLTEGDTDDT